MSRVPRYVVLVLATAGLLAATAFAQLTGPGAETPEALSGRVLAPTGEAVAGARVELAFGPDGRGRRRSAETDAAGLWWVVGLRPGPWRLEISADGFATAVGRVEVAATAGPSVDVTLEVDADAVVRSWLERANAHLEAGEAAAAQALYEQALTVVPLPQSPPVQRALARAHYLQGALDEAVHSLERALLADPTDAEARTLLPGVLAGLGREAEAHRWLETLDREGIAAAGAAAFGVEVPRRDLAERPSGRFRTGFDRPAVQGSAERLLAAFGSWESLGVAAQDPWSPAADSFELYVPPEMAAPAGYGVLVWISPTPRGGPTDPEMASVLDTESLIWIGADGAGNGRPRADRMRLALDAVAGVQAAYPIDPRRIYVGGYSGGGRMASTLALHFPDVFSGGVYFMGVDFYRHVAKPDQPGTLWGAVLEPPSAESRELLLSRSRFVFITGSHDFNRAQTHAYRDEYVADGLDRVTLIEIPDVGHYYGFRAAELAAAVAALDGPQHEGAAAAE